MGVVIACVHFALVVACFCWWQCSLCLFVISAGGRGPLVAFTLVIVGFCGSRPSMRLVQLVVAGFGLYMPLILGKEQKENTPQPHVLFPKKGKHKRSNICSFANACLPIPSSNFCIRLRLASKGHQRPFVM